MRELVDPSKVRCSGPGLGSGVRAHVPQTFTVDSSKAGVAPLEVQLYGPTGNTLTGPVSAGGLKGSRLYIFEYSVYSEAMKARLELEPSQFIGNFGHHQQN